jgi:hypothetical protein
MNDDHSWETLVIGAPLAAKIEVFKLVKARLSLFNAGVNKADVDKAAAAEVLIEFKARLSMAGLILSMALDWVMVPGPSARDEAATSWCLALGGNM